MFLKYIEIRGFKSFADKTEITLKKGVTGIVGPNGSGKSNIADAVRWVLGEQSIKNLRGGKMEDVIFSGTQFRRAVGLSQVSLTLDNEDKKLPIGYTDVTIARRLYRSGESEYYINNTRCRLKDIQQLFMDTGIGKEGYSIIGQGKIDAILSGKPEDRRGLLEEAAGIVKFRWRKDEAQKKLENTDANLIRIDDILRTYNERLEPLRLENEKAKKFIVISKELKDKEVNIVIHSIEEIQIKIDDLDKKSDKISSDIDKLNLDYKNVNDYIVKNNALIEELNLKDEDYKKQYYDNKSRKQNIEANINLLNERLKNAKISIETHSSEFKDIELKVKGLIENKNDIDKILRNLIEKQNFLKENTDVFQKRIDNLSASIYDKSDLVKNLKNDQIEYVTTVSNVKNDLTMMNNNIKELKEKISNMEKQCRGYSNSMDMNLNTKSILQKTFSDMKSEISGIDDKIHQNKKSIVQLNKSVLSCENELREVNTKKAKLEANYIMLNNLEKQHEGYSKSVKILMNDINKGKVNVGKDGCFVLGDVFKVRKKFEIAIEIALGFTISQIITLNDNIARKLIKYLKDNNIGRATFLPLNTVRGKKFTDMKHISSMNGYIGIASDLIEYDTVFTNAIVHILGRTIVVDNMNNALKIAKQGNYSFKIVTLDGQVVNPGGSLTGGSLQHKSISIIGRKRQIHETKFEIDKYTEKVETLDNSIRIHRYEIKKLDDQNLNFKDEIYNKNLEVAKIDQKIRTIEDEYKKLNENIKVCTTEIASLNLKLEETINNIKLKETELQVISNKQMENNKLIIETENKLEDRNKEINENRDKLTGFKVEKAQIDESVLNKRSELQNIKFSIDEMTTKKVNLKDEIKKLEDELVDYKNNINNSRSEILKIDEYLSELDHKSRDISVDLIRIKQELEKHNQGIHDISMDKSKLEKELHKIEILITRFNTEKDGFYTKLNQELEITFEEALKLKKSIPNLESYKRDIFNLKKEISELGVVNLGSIEEYKTLVEKVNFMTSQREDLVSSKSELISLINEMTDKMRDLFAKNFEELRKNFNEIFNQLFKGGSADLILSDGDELTGNIEIKAQPAGKKLQNINLMSGGEKGLSAIALLFAILKMKPTPFCILDEIEAALDDANVVRYADFLKRFSNGIQFIVITHRKGTMEAADVLYGVTMEEKGISKIVSVDLKEKVS
ncbi:chromosome segregation protein SMC [Clostridium fermenticellae]|uniref:Chromosome partition protein Smc n=1 Tax=Clostridium fermenticellae TaxID=2068654 RepID=A0A386H2V3_9CLOT|nr:chromosome segregation protein SMC [Clostridium fermenticellae]AYD40041.1 chromosome segregation protein SMC [Clostridium fermenticellae]